LPAGGSASSVGVVPLALALEERFLSVLTAKERKDLDLLLTKLFAASLHLEGDPLL